LAATAAAESGTFQIGDHVVNRLGFGTMQLTGAGHEKHDQIDGSNEHTNQEGSHAPHTP
jgi:hypothetical protein